MSFPRVCALCKGQVAVEHRRWALQNLDQWNRGANKVIQLQKGKPGDTWQFQIWSNLWLQCLEVGLFEVRKDHLFKTHKSSFIAFKLHKVLKEPFLRLLWASGFSGRSSVSNTPKLRAHGNCYDWSSRQAGAGSIDGYHFCGDCTMSTSKIVRSECEVPRRAAETDAVGTPCHGSC